MGKLRDLFYSGLYMQGSSAFNFQFLMRGKCHYVEVPWRGSFWRGFQASESRDCSHKLKGRIGV